MVAGLGFCAYKYAGKRQEAVETAVPTESHKRLLRSEIPKAPQVSYSDMFPDMNDIQLAAARRGGLRSPERVSEPAACDELVRVESCGAYVIDTLRHSKPYLVPQAAMLLTYIAHRFGEIQDERGVETKVRPIVTSLLRSGGDVRRLRRVNRNASENSCHVYGTTFDLSYTRFADASGTAQADNGRYKDMLAQALYELRFEGLCYVRYERRQPCFHITVRGVDYEGELSCELVGYDVAAGKPALAVAEKGGAEATRPAPTDRQADPGMAGRQAGKTRDVADGEKTSTCSKEFAPRGNYVFD